MRGMKRLMKFIVRKIEKDEAVPFIQKYHYSKILPRLTKYYLGFFDDRGLIGVVTLGWGTQPLHTIKKILHQDDVVTDSYIEIGKMCFSPLLNGNNHSGSQILSLLIKWVKRETQYDFLYTLADGIMGKCGYVYQATNFKYIGSFETSVYRDKTTGEKIHPRSAKALCVENAEWEGKEKVFWLTHDFCEYKGIEKINGLMFRYLMPLNKKAKKMLGKYEEYANLDYPKEDDLIFRKRFEKGKFERIKQPDFNMNVFEHNFQKYDSKESFVQERLIL